MARTESFLEERREDLRALDPAPVNGIDYVEVHMAARQIDVHLVHPMPGGPGGMPQGAAPITPDMVSITGGDRLRAIGIEALAGPEPHVLQITVDALGDFSIYTLVIDHPGFDRMLGQIRFSFRATCQTDFDCAKAGVADAAFFAPANVNYLAKDFDSFRGAMLDRMAGLVPEWEDRHIPDLGVTLVELVAHYADHLSYAQDAAGTEAYIGTARRRASVRRHAQLMGYDVHDGLSAKVFVQVEMAGSGSFGRSDLTFLTAVADTTERALELNALKLDKLVADGVRIFEPVDVQGPDPAAPGQDAWVTKPIVLQESANQLQLYDWGDGRAVLPEGTTSAWIIAPDDPLTLEAGDFVLLELLRDPVTLRRADADGALRQVVALTRAPEVEVDHLGVDGPVDLLKLTWHSEDALRFDLPIGRLEAAQVVDGGAPMMARAGGNLVLADHGVSLSSGEVIGRPDGDDDPEVQDAITALSQLDRPSRFRPVLSRRDISVADTLQMTPEETSVTALLRPGAGRPVKSIWLDDGLPLGPWRALNTLLYARDDDRVFVPETERDGSTILRFGGQETGGGAPSPDHDLTAFYRVGIGRSGNIGAESIAHVALRGAAGPVSARNPLPGFGGRDRESVEEIRLNALRQLDDNRRAVTREDYVRLASEHPGVQSAFVRTMGHGSWTTFVVAVDPVGGIETSPEFLRAIRDHLEPFRLMGQDLIVEAPKFAPIELSLRLCVCRDHSESDVRRAVEAVLSPRRLADGTLGFFHPENITFGAPIYLSRIIAAIKSVPGATDVAVATFKRWRGAEGVSLENGVLAVDASEIPILMNDPNFPERGVLSITPWKEDEWV